MFVNDNEFDLGWGGSCPVWVDKEVGSSIAEHFLGCWSSWDCSPPGYCADGFHGFESVWHCGNKWDLFGPKPTEKDPSIWTEMLVAETLLWIWQGYDS